uniref:Uncharacterized protein n=1 Tax=Anguilla anguilla TaxID=7936 RepID=A0A0E9V5U9_ANGAN
MLFPVPGGLHIQPLASNDFVSQSSLPYVAPFDPLRCEITNMLLECP